MFRWKGTRAAAFLLAIGLTLAEAAGATNVWAAGITGTENLTETGNESDKTEKEESEENPATEAEDDEKEEGSESEAEETNAQNPASESASESTEAGNADSDSYSESEEGLSDDKEPEMKQEDTENQTDIDNNADDDTVISAEEQQNLDEEKKIAEEVMASNEDLIAAQNIILPDVTSLYDEFRLEQDEEAEKAFLVKGGRIYEEESEAARIIGRSFTGSEIFVLKDTGNGWYFVESGEARGFVPAGELIRGEEYEAILSESDYWNEVYCYIDPMDNEAVLYTETTGYNPVAEKVYCIADRDVSIYQDKEIEADTAVAGTLKENGLAYVLADVDDEIMYIESEDVRGFVFKDAFTTGEEAAAAVAKCGEDRYSTAEESVDPEENKALYYTLTSVKEADRSAVIRQSLITFATQFVGNPYVWGGNSLTDGVDCSGFAKQIYKAFGYNLPRSSTSQSKYGEQITLDSALPGDLIFYAKDGKVYHVAIYLGDGKQVEAANEELGIRVSRVGSNAVWATRLLPD